MAPTTSGAAVGSAVVVGMVVEVTVPVAILGSLATVVGMVEVVNEITSPANEDVEAVLPAVASIEVLRGVGTEVELTPIAVAAETLVLSGKEEVNVTTSTPPEGVDTLPVVWGSSPLVAIPAALVAIPAALVAIPAALVAIQQH